jgi:DNA polymerase-3 subunit delta
LDLQRLKEELQAGKILPCYLLVGEESYLAEEALEAIAQSFLGPQDRRHAVVRLYANEKSLEEALHEARTVPLFTSRRLVVVKRAEAWEGLFSRGHAGEEQEEASRAGETTPRTSRASWEALSRYLDDPSERSCLVFVAQEADGRLPAVKRLRQKGALVDCRPPTEEGALRWIRRKAEAMGIGLPQGAAELLLERVGPDLQRLARELEKLSEYGARGEELSEEVLERLVSGQRERSVFELTGAIARGDLATALQRLDDLLTVGEGQGPMHPLVVLSRLAWQIRQFWIIKECVAEGLSELETYNRLFRRSVHRLSSWHRGQLKEIRQAADGFSDEALAWAVKRLLRADEELKGGATNPRRTLETLVVDLHRAGGGR